MRQRGDTEDGESMRLLQALYSIIHGLSPAFRICPGRHMAASTVWITLAQILAVYDLDKARDKDGRVMEPKMELSSFGITLSVQSLNRLGSCGSTDTLDEQCCFPLSVLIHTTFRRCSKADPVSER